MTQKKFLFVVLSLNLKEGNGGFEQFIQVADELLLEGGRPHKSEEFTYIHHRNFDEDFEEINHLRFDHGIRRALVICQATSGFSRNLRIPYSYHFDP